MYAQLDAEPNSRVKKSRKITGETVSISKEEMELLRANYTVDDMPTWAKGVYGLDEVTAKDLPAEKMAELRRHIENISMIDADSKRLNANTDAAEEAAAIEAIARKMKAGAEKPKAEQKAPRQGAAAKTPRRSAPKPLVRGSGDTVVISKGELAKLHANYAGDKVFARKSVTEAVAFA